MRIEVKEIKTGNLTKRIRKIESWLKNPIAGSDFKKTENKIHDKWILECEKTFNVRANMGMRCDNLIQQALDITTRKDSIIVYIKPIKRKFKGTNSSGGAVNNLTSILFYTGSQSSDSSSEKWAGMYYPKWDCRVQTGRHPGTSPSQGRAMWKRFTKWSRRQIRESLRRGLQKVRGK